MRETWIREIWILEILIGSVCVRKEDLSVVALLLEAINLILGIVYMGLQIFYGIYYHVPPYKFILNLLVMILVYAGLTLLSMYPEKINSIPRQVCQGRVRKYSLWMVRLVKTIFVVSLLIPCVFDVMGVGIQSVYSLIVIGLILVVAGYCEYHIIQELKNRKK